MSGFTINAPGGTAALFATAILVSGIDVEIFNNALTLSKGGVGGTPSVGIYTIVANAFDGLSIHDNTIGDDGSGSGLGFQGIPHHGPGERGDHGQAGGGDRQRDHRRGCARD